MNKSHTFLFHETLKSFKKLSIQHKKMIVGVSGGLDSMVLMRLLQELSSVCKLEFLISYIHHGLANDKKTQDYRDKAYKLISQTCEKNNFLFFSSKSKKRLKSEEAFRNFRHREFKKLLKQEKADLIVLAHNQNDLLETRLINLIRGSGRQGLNSMKFYQAPYLRPLLNFSREEIKKYCKTCKLNFLEDPSNKDNSYLRNWIRNKWLKDLEKKRSGSLKSLARSLELLSDTSASKSYNSHSVRNFHEKRNLPTHNNKNKGDLIGKSEAGKRNNNKETTRTDDTKIKAEEKIIAEKGISVRKEITKLVTSKGINRKFFLELSLEDQKRILASYMRRLKFSNYGQSHIQELIKHNKRTEKNFQIKLLKKTWVFTEDQITIK